MTTPPDETTSEYFNRMSDDGSGGLDTPPDIEDHIRSSFSDLGTVFDNPNDLPVTASARPAGTFSEASSARVYLENGGLLATANDGAETVPMSFVYFLERFDEILQEPVWEVWIDDDTGA